MTKKIERLLLAAGAAVAALAFAGAAQAACVGAGVVTRIDGNPAGVNIARAGAAVSRPRVLEVVCVGDRIAATGDTRLTLSLDGRGVVKVDAKAPFVVAARAGAPTMVGNAYRAVNDQVMPDMKRLPWDVRLKGGADSFGFALPQLAAGSQELSPGPRALLVRLTGGAGPYKATLSGPGGQVLGEASGAGDLVFATISFAPGRYHLAATDASGGAVQADFTVSAGAPGLPQTYAALSDPEVRAAATACALARADSATHALEAEQVLAAAPSNGLDRARVYALIESYGLD
ncbi:hypothetical protein ACO2Q3_00250 [Caulobacter sp. KR2-114]|uniref:hypothetical protein n=1 Tax=Caulobacter sp. KR2-114 TaxID=3400912 RepID=UPI003BFD4BFB